MKKCKKLCVFHVNNLQRKIENFHELVYRNHYTKEKELVMYVKVCVKTCIDRLHHSVCIR